MKPSRDGRPIRGLPLDHRRLVPEAEALWHSPGDRQVALDARRTLAAPAEALPQLRRSVELDPRNGQARYYLATVLLESRQYDDALEEFRAALRLMPESAELHNNLGVTLASQGKLDEAINQFQQALRLQPQFANARRNLRMALQEQRRRADNSAPRGERIP